MIIDRFLKIKRNRWKMGEEWYETWYATEQCLRILNKDENKIVKKLFLSHRLNTIALNARWYYAVKDYRLYDKDRQNAIEQDSFFLEKLIKEEEKYIQRIEKVILDVEKINEINLEAFRKIKKRLYETWYIFLSDFGKYIPEIIDNKLKQKSFSEEEIGRVKDYYCSVFKNPLEYQREERELKEIALLYKKQIKSSKDKSNFNDLPKEIQKLLHNHWRKYRFLTCSDLDADPYTLDDYLQKMLVIKNEKKRKRITLPRNIRKKLDKKDLSFLELINRHTYLDNYTADLYSKINFILVNYLSIAHKLQIKNLSWYTWKELEELVTKGIEITTKQLNLRKQYRIMIQINEKLNVLYGEKWYKKIQVSVQDKQITTNVTEFKGIVASRGQATGAVKIIQKVKDISKMETGDILVATNTHPDLMLAIRKASAIVTDSGGITSHAAIVAREFGIPCIVGAEIATQVLHDRDIIEVDAIRGKVKILERVN